jgi:hypothetical protein
MDKTQESKGLLPVLFSLPAVNRLSLPSRAELLPKIENGEIDHLDFRAQVFSPFAKNLNPYQFRVEDMPTFAASFEGQPYLRDHDTYSIDSRDGTLISSAYDGQWINADVRLTTRRGMLDYLEGKMDRFSIGWFYDDALCSICEASFFSRDCAHWPGASYKVGNGTKKCILTFVNPKGKELSAVNVPAVQGTGITGALAEYKLSLIEDLVIENAPSNPVDGPLVAASKSHQAVENEREACELRDHIQLWFKGVPHGN